MKELWIEIIISWHWYLNIDVKVYNFDIRLVDSFQTSLFLTEYCNVKIKVGKVKL